MTQIISTYARGLIAALTVGLLLAATGGVLARHVLADGYDRTQRETTTEATSPLSDMHRQIKAPVVGVSDVTVYEGEAVDPGALFTADGEVIAACDGHYTVTVNEAEYRGVDGRQRADGNVSREGDAFIFSKVGIYRLKVTVNDTKGLMTTSQVYINVRQKGVLALWMHW